MGVSRKTLTGFGPSGILRAMEQPHVALRRIRGARTQIEAAKILGVGLRTYVRYESGTRRIPEPVWRLAKLLLR